MHAVEVVYWNLIKSDDQSAWKTDEDLKGWRRFSLFFFFFFFACFEAAWSHCFASLSLSLSSLSGEEEVRLRPALIQHIL